MTGNSAALPEKVVITVSGRPISPPARLDGVLTAAPSELPGCKLKDNVTAGNLAFMHDRERSGHGPQPSERAQRHHLAGGGLDVPPGERLGRELEPRLGFENDAVPVELGEHGRYLALSEGVVERSSIACGRIPRRDAVSRST